MNRALIIEDEPSYQKILKDTFEKASFKVTCVSDVSSANTQINNQLPDLIILDIMLPGGKNGFDLLEQLMVNNLTKDIPVIVLTNMTTEGDVAKEIGAEFYAVKSDVSIDKVIEKAKQLTS